MAQFNLRDLEKYGGQGGGGFFSLKDDRDTAKVRFLYDSVDDVKPFSVHEIKDEKGSKFSKKSVNCPRLYGDPIDDCPFCKKGWPTKVKFYVPLYNIDQNRIQIWEKGKKFGQELSSLCAHYPHLVSHTFEIERIGKAGDQQTIYKIYETGHDDKTLRDFDEVPNPLGTVLQNRTTEDMQYYVDRGVFMDDDSNTSRRDSAYENDSRAYDNRAYDRRTPANMDRTTDRREESF